MGIPRNKDDGSRGPDGINYRCDRNSKCIVPLRNQISVAEPAGADTFVTMVLGGKGAVARMWADVNVGPKDVVEFAVNMEKAVAFDSRMEKRISP